MLIGNAASGRSARQSTTEGGEGATFAVDGDYDTCSQTQRVRPFIKIKNLEDLSLHSVYYNYLQNHHFRS